MTYHISKFQVSGESSSIGSKMTMTKFAMFQRSCLAALYDLYASDSLQKAVTALYAKILVIMGGCLTRLPN